MFWVVWNNFKNNTLLVTDNDLNTPTATYGVLCQYNKFATPQPPHVPPSKVIFLQMDDTINAAVPGSYERFLTDVTCYKFQKTEHNAGNCPSSTSSTSVGSQYPQVWFPMDNKMNDTLKPDIINLNWLLLDTCSTISPVKNK